MNNNRAPTAAGPDSPERSIDQIIQAKLHLPGALLEILHDIQNAKGYIPDDAVASIAKALRQTRADVHGVISFYDHFRCSPPGCHIVKVCRAEACQARGARPLEQHIKQTLGIDYHQTTPDREISLEPVYCLGNCACGPNIQVDDEIKGRITKARFDQLAEALTHQPLEVK